METPDAEEMLRKQKNERQHAGQNKMHAPVDLDEAAPERESETAIDHDRRDTRDDEGFRIRKEFEGRDGRKNARTKNVSRRIDGAEDAVAPAEERDGEKDKTRRDGERVSRREAEREPPKIPPVGAQEGADLP